MRERETNRERERGKRGTKGERSATYLARPTTGNSASSSGQGAGINSVILMDLMKTKDNLSFEEWRYQVGLKGESLGLDSIKLANSSLWTKGSTLPVNRTLIWYKTTFLAPEGKGPLSITLASRGKGQAWIYGQGIGRYWSAYLAPSTGCTDHCDYRGNYDSFKCQKKCGQPAQTLYHIPRSWVHPGENLLVLLEELGGDPSKISFLSRMGHELCASVSNSLRKLWNS